MASTVVFPLELRDQKAKWPFIRFSIPNEPAASDIYLPMPQGLSFSDAALYTNINLGIVGNIGQKLATDMVIGRHAEGSGSQASKMISAGTKSLTESIVKTAKSANLYAAASIAARQLRMDDVANVIDYGTKQVVAPNTRTSFENSSIRSFAFQFKMVGRVLSDNLAINDICRIFRTYIYPEGDDLVMKYPPIWNIEFYDGEGQRNPFIPGIYDCFLTTFTSTYNSSTNMYHEDGSPLEVDVSIGFQETKALTRQEIEKLDP